MSEHHPQPADEPEDDLDDKTRPWHAPAEDADPDETRKDPQADASASPSPSPTGASPSNTWSRLDRLPTAGTQNRYARHGEVARGGMGAILRVWDENLRRPLAMKVILGQDGGSETTSDALPPVIVQRFLDEAQIAGQLEHPGVVPVHELGLNEDGQVFFTMRLVEGRDLKDIFDLVHSGREGWTLTRALEVIIKCCDTLAYAHAKKVIHRDLKPANVMVGRFGEVYVMDWGLAKVLDDQEHIGKDAPSDLANHDASATDDVRTDQRHHVSGGDTPLMTIDGAVLGTPAYMPPEQAQGRLSDLGPRSDVYSLGAMLYHLLAGHAPYLPPDSGLTGLTLLAEVKKRAPEPLHRLDRSIAPELVAICEKAMARDPEQRYPDTEGIGEDLRAYLDNRVVQAHRTGALAELGKWVQRNKGLAASMAATVVALATGLALTLVLYDEVVAARNAAIEEKNNADDARDLAEEREKRATRAERESSRLARREREARTEAERQSSIARAGLAQAALQLNRPEEALLHTVHAVGSSLLDLEGIRKPGTTSAESIRDALAPEVRSSLFTAFTALRQGSVTRAVLEGHLKQKKAVHGLAFRPDGKVFVSVSADQTVQFWDGDGAPLACTPPVSNYALHAVALSTDGRTLVVGGQDYVVRVFVQTPQGFALKKGINVGAEIGAVAVDPTDDGSIVYGTHGGLVTVWRWREQADFIAGVKPTGNPIWTVAISSLDFSPDGRTFVSAANGSREIILWDRQGNRIATLAGWDEETGNGKGGRHATFSPDGTHLATAGFDGMVRLWSRSDDTPDRWELRWEAEGHEGEVLTLCFTPNGETIVSGGGDTTLRLWDLEGRPLTAPLSGHQAWISDVAVRPDGERIVSASGDGEIRLWDLRDDPSGRIIGSVPTGTPPDPQLGWINSVGISADGNTIACGGHDAVLRIWDRRGNLLGESDHGMATNGMRNIIKEVAVSADGEIVATAAKTVSLWDRQARPLPGTEPLTATGDLASLGMSDDAGTIVAGDWQRLVAWQDRERLELPISLIEVHKPLVAASGDGGTMICTDAEKRLGGIALWQQGWQAPRTLSDSDQKNFIRSLAISRNGQTIAAGYESREVRLWNADGASIGTPLLGHMGPVHAVAVSSDGRTIASSDTGPPVAIRLWDRDGAEIGRPLAGHTSHISTLAISTEGTTIVSGSFDGTVRLWNLEDEAVWLEEVCAWLEDYRPPQRLEDDARAARDVVRALNRTR